MQQLSTTKKTKHQKTQNVHKTSISIPSPLTSCVTEQWEVPKIPKKNPCKHIVKKKYPLVNRLSNLRKSTIQQSHLSWQWNEQLLSRPPAAFI